MFPLQEIFALILFAGAVSKAADFLFSNKYTKRPAQIILIIVATSALGLSLALCAVATAAFILSSAYFTTGLIGGLIAYHYRDQFPLIKQTLTKDL